MQEMTSERPRAEFRILFLITTPKLADKAQKLFEEGRVPMLYRFHAEGTATSEWMEILGLGGIEKRILMCMLPKAFADEMLRKLKKQLKLGLANSGIAFTVALTGGGARVLKLLETAQPEDGRRMAEQEESRLEESRYALIMAIVDQGYSEEVMAVAREVGAGGGTVFHSRRVGSEEAVKFWGISVQQEREVVLILTEKAHKQPILKAIGERCGMRSKARGVAVSLPVDAVAGME